MAANAHKPSSVPEVNRGIFITFEGTEGAGKSTQIKILAERLKLAGREVICLREPGGTAIGEEIRHTLQHSHQNHSMVPETELLLMNASRAQLVSEVIRPALLMGKVVLCDRFFDSTVAYQGFGRGLERGDVDRIIDFAVKDNKPDLTLLLRIPLTVSEYRRKRRPVKDGSHRDRMEEEKREFFERVEAGFEYQLLQYPRRIKAVDGTKEITTLHEEIWTVVTAFLSQ